MGDPEAVMETITSHVVRSLTAFRVLAEPGTKTLLFPEPWILRKLQDENTRFSVWSGNIGAHKIGTGSLDYRLRDASHIRQQVVSLLEELWGLLGRAAAIAAGEETPWDQLDDEEPLEDIDLDSDSPRTELGQIATEGVADVVDCLIRLSMIIRSPAPHDRYINWRLADIAHFKPYDIQHVQAKWPAVEPWLTERLGNALCRRRGYFRYRESHHLKLSQGLDNPDRTTDNCDETIASPIPSYLKDKSKPNQTDAFPTVLEDDYSDTGASQTSYATSVSDSEALRIPTLPKEAQAGPFQCRFCYMMIVATNKVTWK